MNVTRPRDVGNGVDRHALVSSLKGRTQNRQLLMRLQSSEALVGRDHGGRDPSQGHTGIPPAFDVARDAANGAHHVLGDVGTGERATKLLRQLQPDDSQDFVEVLKDAGRYAGPLLVETTREIADRFFCLVSVIELPGLVQYPTGGPMMLFRPTFPDVARLVVWQRWIAATEPKVRRIAFGSAFAPSAMNSLGTVGSSPREIRLSSRA